MKKMMVMLLCATMISSLIGAGGVKEVKAADYTPISGLDTTKEVSLKIATVFEMDKALDMVVNQFMEKYPNVDVQLEYIEDYDTNTLELLKNNEVDIVFQRDLTYQDNVDGEPSEEEGETADKPDKIWTTDDLYYDFAADEEINLSNTTQKLMGNYTHTRTDEANHDLTYQYSVPVGGEVRGIFVNQTLLDSVGEAVPTNWEEFLDCCESLQKAGYVPIQGNPGTAAMSIMMASCVNGVVHDDTMLEQMKNAESGVSTLFQEPFEKLYLLATKRYYDYKYVEEELGNFKGVSDIGQAMSFLGLMRNEETYEYELPENNYGTVAFFPYLSFLGSTLDRLIDEYQLDTEYTFIATPTASEGGNPVYLTPFYGICGNKNSENLDWIREFVNFFFQEDMNQIYAENAEIIPNTTNAIEYMADKYGVNPDTDCASCGDIYFSDSYNGFSPLATVLVNTSKCEAQKYMVKLNKDTNGEIQYETDEEGREYLLTDEDVKIYKEYVGEEDSTKPGYAFCNLQYYMDQLEEQFAKYRES